MRVRGLTTLKQPSIIDLKKQNEVFQKDSEKLKKILQQYEGRRKKLIEQIAFEKAELVNGGMYRFLCMTEVSNILSRRTPRASQDNLGWFGRHCQISKSFPRRGHSDEHRL
jgi:hypothetical protein